MAGQVAPPTATASKALGELRQQIQTVFVPALVKPPLAEVQASRDAAVASLAAGLGWVGLVSWWAGGGPGLMAPVLMAHADWCACVTLAGAG